MEAHIYLAPQGIRLTGNLQKVRTQFYRLAANYATLQELRRYLEKDNDPGLTLLPLEYDKQ